jgi:hypothetical protein
VTSKATRELASMEKGGIVVLERFADPWAIFEGC